MVVHVLLFVCLTVIPGCQKERQTSEKFEAELAPGFFVEAPYSARLSLPEEAPLNYASPKFPEHYRVESLGYDGQKYVMSADNTPAYNPITDHGATLGRVLFYDKHLSKNGTVACASCHQAAYGFSDDRVQSEGFEGGHTGRHSMGLTNARFYGQGHFFWDQRASTLEAQVLMPLQDPVEMGMTLPLLVARVKAGRYYPALFEAAFGDESVTAERISKALAQFVRSMVSAGSKYDIGRAQVASRIDAFPNFSAEENRGKYLFSAAPAHGGLGCFSCHRGEAFIARRAANNGLDNEAPDRGYGEVSGEARDEGTFKVPSLRNVALRAPYMHDGRFADLEAVVEHYRSGVKNNPTLSSPLRGLDGELRKISISAEDKRALVAFLKTLTDLDMITDPKFSDPFVAD